MPERLNGLVIDERLASLGVSPKEFAHREEISEGYFRNLRGGVDLCSRRTAHRIARGLALPVDDIVAESIADGRRLRAAKPERKAEPTAPPKRQEQEKTTGPKRVAA